jgi:prepilin-type N-terminal cleavage/methylation domain-containing protein/prepilin-type processing-associated H-X9-DG protein
MKNSLKGHALQVKRAGFTLIELLVVIAIIAILASILFPVFGRARENARRSSCQSNLKQIGLGIMQYTQDYDEKYMFDRWFNTGNPERYMNWAQAVQPYVKSRQLFACPSNTDNEKVMGWSDPPPAIQMPASYGLNHEIGRDYWNGGVGMSQAVMQEVSRKILVGERLFGTAPQEPGIMWDDWDGNQWVNDTFAGHLGTANYLFADGHVKSMRPLQTVAGGYSMWGKWRNTACTLPNSQGINCNEVSPAAVTALGLLDKKYN